MGNALNKADRTQGEVSDETDNSICHMWNTDRYDSDV